MPPVCRWRRSRSAVRATPALLAVRILGAADPQLRDRVEAFQRDLEAMVLAKDAALRDRLLGEIAQPR